MTDETVQAGQPEKIEPKSEEVQNGSESTEKDDPRNKRDRRAERRISTLTARNAALVEKDKARDEQFAKMQTQIDGLSKTARPQRDDFEDQEVYEDALFDWKDGQKQKTEVPADTGLVKRFESFIDAGDKDFGEVVQNAHFALTDHALSEIIDMGEDGREIFTYLNEKPAEAMRISRLSARDQTIELDKLADVLDSHETKAPEPIKPVEGNDKPIVDESQLSDAQWIARRNKKVLG